MKAREGHHVDGEFAQIGVELAGETKAGGDSGHGEGDEVVEVAVGRVGELQCAEADVVEGLVVNAEGLIGVFDQLVDGQRGVVRFHNCIRDLENNKLVLLEFQLNLYLGRRDHAVRVHDPVWKLLPDLGDEESSHSRPSSTAKGVSQLETLEAVANLGLLSDNVKDRVDQFRTLRSSSAPSENLWKDKSMKASR